MAHYYCSLCCHSHNSHRFNKKDDADGWSITNGLYEKHKKYLKRFFATEIRAVIRLISSTRDPIKKGSFVY